MSRFYRTLPDNRGGVKLKKILLLSETVGWSNNKKLSYDAKSVNNYKDLTADNFMLEITNLRYKVWGNHSAGYVSTSYKLQYNKTTGILSTEGLLLTGADSNFCNDTISFNLYLIITE